MISPCSTAGLAFSARQAVLASTLLLATTLAAPAVSAQGLVGRAVPTQGVVDFEIDGSKATASLELFGGLQADLELEFDSVLGLSAAALGLSIELVSITDPLLLARLPNLGSIPAGLPMLIRVQPPSTGPLTFEGTYEINLHTENLEYTANTPLRLFKAEGGGDFHDITANVGQGSYRVRGTSGGFSEFLIAVEARSSNTVIEAKYDRLRAALTAGSASIPATVYNDLLNLLDSSELYGYELDDHDLAQDELKEFIELVEDHAGGSGIPNVWRSSGDLDNLAGTLVAHAETLIFSLRMSA